MADDFEKTDPNLKVTLDLDDQLTWGELIRFVNLAQSAGKVSPDQPVGMEYDPNDTHPVITGLCVYLDAENIPQGS
ncbi:hypothetical protein [Micromonospora sp. 4G55]|uniref:hypothetical protein n=1 Tax=Micromonospora sp. 4G55 TaxID=2806102 RepID=UPI001A47AC1E|nr:hypothetical protein [Micromonospora sp. 4G55]MBM0258960.1 hypothetical protein [Micromonospora sp. 4G55]